MMAVLKERLFSYGTLQLESVQLATFDRLLVGQPDALIGFQLGSLPINDPNVIAISGKATHTIAKFTGRESDTISGIVYEVTSDELDKADGYEVAPCKRVSVTLQSGACAWVYVHGQHAPPQP